MGVNIEVYRFRIGTFIPPGQNSYKCIESYKPRQKNYFYFRRLLVILQVLLLVRGVYSTRTEQWCIRAETK